jgi:hypothetical protein
LAAVPMEYPTLRTFMFVVAEADGPDRFVNEKGNSRRGKHPIHNTRRSIIV